MTTDLHKLATSFLSAFTNLSPADHLFLRSPTCTQIFAPSSISLPPKSNAEFESHLTSMRKILDHFPVTAKEIHVNPTANQVVIWATGKPEFNVAARGAGNGKASEDDAGEWDYTGEYIFILDVDGEGKICRIVEFLDSLATERLRGVFRKARENLNMGATGMWA